jgi:hypothetical protein
MDFCKCEETGVDLEEYGCRYSTNFFNELKKTLKEYDYNFFEEITICMKEQGYDIDIKISDRLYIKLSDVMKIREFEDEMLEGLK